MSQKRIQQNISRLMVLLLCLSLVLAGVPAVSAAEGSCGDKLTWSLVDGTLTIEGSGDMWDFSESTMAPWHSMRGEIKTLVLPEGLTHVGALAFYDCSRLTTVDIPEKVRSIGAFAFASCENLQMLDLGDSLQSIGNDAFHGCWALQDVRLPQSLQMIGDQAFYDCSSITNLVIPEKVETLGSAVFAYCTSLVRAEVQTKLVRLPEWTFFGCTQLSTLILPETITEMGNAALRDCHGLNTVSYGGSSLNMEELKDSIAEDVPGFGTTGLITQEPPTGPVTGGTATENADGTVTEQITIVTGGENSTVSTTIDRVFNTDSENTVSSNITVTIENDDGWEDAIEGVDSALKDVADRAQPGTIVETSNVTVYIKDSDTLSEDFVEPLAGRDVEVSVITKDGSNWTIDCSNMKDENLSGAYDLRYILEPADEDALNQMGVKQGYRIRFAEDSAVEAELKVLLPDSAVRQTATLFKHDSDDFVKYQSVVVDAEGYAHLYLASVDGGADYYLGINVPDAKEVAVVPATMQNEYPAISYAEPIQYEITGRTSSWGMSLGQVMGILAIVMVSVVVVVGVVMYIWNKRRVKNGYIPDWDDDYE